MVAGQNDQLKELIRELQKKQTERKEQ